MRPLSPASRNRAPVFGPRQWRGPAALCDTCEGVDLSQSWIQDADRIDLAIYGAVAATSTPTLDAAMSRLTRAANYSRLSVAAAALLAVAGGTGRRAATRGLASLAVTATAVYVAIKPLARRRRPGRVARNLPLARHVQMPVSRSFPSGHAGVRIGGGASVKSYRWPPSRCAPSPHWSAVSVSTPECTTPPMCWPAR